MTEEKRRRILASVDHTILRAAASWEEIKTLCDEAVQYGTASVCIPPSYVKRASQLLGGKIAVCTVVGFPLGYQTTAVKVFEAEKAIEDGADEVDAVINIGSLKTGDFASGDFVGGFVTGEAAVEAELRALRKAAAGKILKIIIETCYLEDAEKIKMCRLITKTGCDFIKTSTGFGTAGAKLEDIALFKANIGQNVRIKAAGGMKTASDHEAFFDAGCSRLGSSSAIKALGKH